MSHFSPESVTNQHLGTYCQRQKETGVWAGGQGSEEMAPELPVHIRLVAHPGQSPTHDTTRKVAYAMV